jgi:acrylyl-CoA reductase (NADPH)
MSFSAILIEKTDAGQKVGLTQLEDDQLPEGDVTIDVDYSTLNFKDALAITGKSPIVRRFPLVPGIDLAGAVRSSDHPDWKVGDKVVLNGWGVGESHSGGLAQRARMKGEWLVPLPGGLSTRQAMAIGTAGYTSALCVEALLNYGVEPSQGEVLVTGATGGVGSVAIALLAKAGFQVVAATGKASEADYLKSLGASGIIDRGELAAPGKPLQKERWAGVVDAVGSHTLANAAAQTREGGALAVCGLAQGMDLNMTVAPLILRGVSLLGIESVRAPKAKRLAAWNRLARDLDPKALDSIATEVGLGEAIPASETLLNGGVRGRLVVNVNR